MNIRPISNVLLLLFVFGGSLSQAQDRVTYSKDIAPIVQRYCQECHRPGQMGPFSAMDYASVRPWAKSIRKEVHERRMPPWHADPSLPTKFANDRSLSEEQIETILRWVDQGAPKGDDADLPPPLNFAEGWTIGEPDLVFELPVVARIPAEGEVQNLVFYSETGLEDDVWIQAVEARPGNERVVHHLMVNYIDPLDESRQRNSQRITGHVVGTAPGKSPTVFPMGVGSKLPKGAILKWGMHYAPTGQPETDRSRIGLILTKEPPKQKAVWRQIDHHNFTVPAGDSNYLVEAEYTFDDDVLLYSLYPHMHYRGKSFRFEAEWPDGRREALLDVPRFDFYWQTIYYLAEPLQLPAGTKMYCTAYFDNSEDNPLNPDATVDVPWGDQSEDEMMIGVFTTIEPRDRKGVYHETMKNR